MKLISVVATVSLLVLISACEKKAETPPQVLEKASAEVKKPVAEVTELKIEDTKTGDGAVAEAGKRVTVQAVQVVTVQGNQIKETRHYFDMLGMLQQIGAAAR